MEAGRECVRDGVRREGNNWGVNIYFKNYYYASRKKLTL